MSSRSSSTDPLETVLRRARPGLEQSFRRHGLTTEEAEQILLEALGWLESPHGLVRGASRQLEKRVEEACRRPAAGGNSAGPPPAGYQEVFDRAAEHLRRQRRERERERAEYLQRLAEIDPRSTAWASAFREIRFSRELALALLEHAWEFCKTDPRQALETAETVRVLLDKVPEESRGAPFVADLIARAEAYTGHARRILGDFRQADRDLESAQAALGRGTGDPRERAHVLWLLGTLRRDQRRFPEAIRHLQQAAAIYRWAGEAHLAGRVYASMAIVQSYSGHSELAIPLAQRAAELIDPVREPRLEAVIKQNLVHYLCESERASEARDRLPEVRRLTEQQGTPADLRGIHWIEAEIALALGDRETGERIFCELREEYARVGDSFNAALVSLELVAVYLDQGRAADAKRLAAESLPIFQSLEIHRETLAALIALQRATEVETATAGVVRELLERMRRGNAAPPPRPEKPS